MNELMKIVAYAVVAGVTLGILAGILFLLLAI